MKNGGVSTMIPASLPKSVPKPKLMPRYLISSYLIVIWKEIARPSRTLRIRNPNLNNPLQMMMTTGGIGHIWPKSMMMTSSGPGSGPKSMPKPNSLEIRDTL